jgi:hypothetical protein
MRTRTIAYWATTGFLVFNMLSGGLAELAQLDANAEGMRALGYAPYVMTILGVWKVLGTVVLLAPRLERLKEWAYAGVVFNMTGAAVSHAVSGSEAWHVYYTGFVALLALASWALRPASRTLAAPLFGPTPLPGVRPLLAPLAER